MSSYVLTSSRTDLRVLLSLFLLTALPAGCGSDDDSQACTLDSEGCEPAETFTLGPAGGVYSFHHVVIAAEAGDLTEEVELEIARCPGAGSTNPQPLSYTFEQTGTRSPAKVVVSNRFPWPTTNPPFASGG